MRGLAFVIPGSLATRTGGYRYDDRIITALRLRGWQVSVHELHGAYPAPDAGAIDAADAVLQGLPDGHAVVIDGLALGALPALVKAHRQRLRLVALIHHPLALETGLDAQTAAALQRSEQSALKAVRGVIVTSQATADLLPAYGVAPTAVHVVEPGTDDPIARAIRRPQSPDSDAEGAPVTLLCVASLTLRKGHAVLFEALAPWRDANWMLHCVGSTQRDPRLVQARQRQLTSLGLTDRVALVGETDDETLGQHYRRADGFVLSSYFEGYGMVFDEAVAYGLPVISTRVGAIESAVPAGGRALVAPGDVAGLSRVLGRFIHEPAWRETLTQNTLAAASGRRAWDQAGAAFDRALCAFTS